MKEETAVELLKIATQLTITTFNATLETKNTHTVRKRCIEDVLSDCVAATKNHFDSLTGAVK